MSGPQELVLFGLTLHVERTEADAFRIRAVYRIPALTAGITAYTDRAALSDLLAQIERQYHDFDVPLAWEAAEGEKRLALGWSLDSTGHVIDGRVRLFDGAWSLDARLDGDQSYLPSVALGLNLLLRSGPDGPSARTPEGS